MGKEFLTVITSAAVGILDFLCDTYCAVSDGDEATPIPSGEKIAPKDAKAKIVDAKKGVIVTDDKDFKAAMGKAKVPAAKVQAAINAMSKVDTSGAKKYFK